MGGATPLNVHISQQRQLLTYPLPLAGGAVAYLQLPKDFSTTDAARLKGMINALAVGEVSHMTSVQTSTDELADAVAEWNYQFGEPDEIEALEAIALIACDLHGIDVEHPRRSDEG